MKTSELQGAALDWAVATCEEELDEQDYYIHESTGAFMLERGEVSWVYSPSTNWSQGGPIIEREKITVGPNPFGIEFIANVRDIDMYGPTLLIAAMRCYVTSKLGDEVEIPEAMK